MIKEAIDGLRDDRLKSLSASKCVHYCSGFAHWRHRTEDGRPINLDDIESGCDYDSDNHDPYCNCSVEFDDGNS